MHRQRTVADVVAEIELREQQGYRTIVFCDDNLFLNNTLRAAGLKLRFERGFRNRLIGNEVPTNAIVRTEGSPASAAVTLVSDQPQLRVQVDAYSSTTFEDSNGRVYDPEEDHIPTEVTTNGSTLKLTAVQIDTTSTVVARPLWVKASPGPVWVNPSDLTNSSASGRRWIAAAASPGHISARPPVCPSARPTPACCSSA